MAKLKTIEQLFAEACGLSSPTMIPGSLASIIGMMRVFCAKLDVEWVIEEGYELTYCVFINYQPNYGKPWHVHMESDDLKIAIINAVAIAWTNSYEVRKTSDNIKVISLDDWKKRK